jgi:hypothetical protein
MPSPTHHPPTGWLQDPDSAVRCINIDPERRQLVAGTEFGKLLLWDMDRLDGGWVGRACGSEIVT